MKAISIRQPWAWLIVNGHKDIENRSWPTKLRGRVFIHASKTMTGQDYSDAVRVAAPLGIDIPDIDELPRGGIVGAVDIVDCVTESVSPWFFGKHGFVLENALPHDFTPCKGMLGFFEAKT